MRLGIGLMKNSGTAGDASWSRSLDVDSLYEEAQQRVLKRFEERGVWDEDILCLNVALTEFIG